MDLRRYMKLQGIRISVLARLQKNHSPLCEAFEAEGMALTLVSNPPEENSIARKKWIIDALNELGALQIIKEFTLQKYQDLGIELISERYLGGPISKNAWKAAHAIECYGLNAKSKTKRSQGRPKTFSNKLAVIYAVESLKEEMISSENLKPTTRDVIRKLIVRNTQEPKEELQAFKLRVDEEEIDAVIRIEKYIGKNKKAVAEEVLNGLEAFQTIGSMFTDKATLKPLSEIFILE